MTADLTELEAIAKRIRVEATPALDFSRPETMRALAARIDAWVAAARVAPSPVDGCPARCPCATHDVLIEQLRYVAKTDHWPEGRAIASALADAIESAHRPVVLTPDEEAVTVSDAQYEYEQGYNHGYQQGLREGAPAANDLEVEGERWRSRALAAEAERDAALAKLATWEPVMIALGVYIENEADIGSGAWDRGWNDLESAWWALPAGMRPEATP